MAKRSVRSAPTREALTREAIVASALELMDAVGVDGFSMRRLATRLGVSPQALYWHFSDKDDLCRAVVEHIRAELRVETDPSLPVDEQIRAHMRALRQHYAQHPSAVDLGRRFFPSAAGRPSEIGMGLIRAIGITDPHDALRYYRALVWTVVGFGLMQQGAGGSIHHTAVDSRRGVFEVRLRASGPDESNVSLDRLDVDELFETVVDMFVAGLVRAAAGA